MRFLITERQTFIDTAHRVRERSTARDDNESRRPARVGDGCNDAVEMIDVFEQAASDFDDKSVIPR